MPPKHIIKRNSEVSLGMDSKKNEGLSSTNIILLVIFVLVLVSAITFGTQYFIDKNIDTQGTTLSEKKKGYEISKLEAEISRIRSDTAGSLFWLKLFALFVTVGGAVGGYLIGQSRTTMEKLKFEDRKNVDEVYQTVVRELADDASILRAAAAVKLGAILKSFPAEWNVSIRRKKQLLQLTKQVLAAALSIETDSKVLKTITISLVLHDSELVDKLSDGQGLDLSGAQAKDAYWANCNFQYVDFYNADLSFASFRKSNLSGAQFRESNLLNAVLAGTTCKGTNFKMANLRGVTFEESILDGVNFENAKVHSVSIKNAEIKNIPDCQVDISEDDGAPKMISINTWLKGFNEEGLTIK